MGRISKEEERKQHLSELNTQRVARYRAKHSIRQYKFDLEEDKFNEISERLKADGVTKKDFVLKSFENYVKNNGF